MKKFTYPPFNLWEGSKIFIEVYLSNFPSKQP